MSQVNPESLETGYRLVMSDPDRETEARGVDLGLKSGLSAKTARALSAELTLPVVDWRSFIADAPTVSGLLAKDGAVMTTAAPYVDELWLQEKQLRRWNVRRPGEKAAQDRLGLLETTLGSVYMGLKDVGRGLTAIHRNFVGEVQKTLRDVNLDEVPGLDDESRAMLQDFNNVNLDKLTEDILPVFDWMKTHDQDVANASPFLRFVSDVFRSLPTTGAALIGGAVGGPVGAAAAGGSIVYGQSLDSYENDPTVTVAPEERRLYALGNAVIQGALEATGTRGLLAAFKPRGARGKALKVWFEGAVKEGVTEGAQEFPDRLFLEMARGADPTDKEDLRHLLNVFMSSEFWEDARYSALVGAAAGGLVTAPGIQAQRRAFAAQEAAFAAMPAMAKLFPNTYKLILRRHVEAGNVSREVFVPSAAVEGLFQEDATSQDVLDFLDKAGIAPADYEAARASGAPLSIPFENIADVLNDERGQALRGRLDISLEQESAGASVTAEILESVRKGELSPENMPEDERALEEIREELGLDELGLDERAFIKQDVVDAIINATAGTENAYTAEQARAYADIIDAIVATFAATHGLTYRGAFNLVAPEFARGDISVEEMDALRTQAREAASSPEAMEQDFALATNRGKAKKGAAAPRMTLEERAPLLALVRGRLDGKSLKRDFPEAYRELMQAHGRGLFRNAAKGGIAIDELADEAVSRGLLPQGAGSSELVEYLKAERRELFQSGNPLASRFADMPMIDADSSAWFGEGKAIEADKKKLRSNLKEWARKNFSKDTSVSNADTGWEVLVTPRSIEKSLSHGFDELLARSVPFIPQIIEGGIHVASIEKKPGLMSHIFANKIRLDGRDYVVGFVLREDVNGNRFYDHELTEIINPDSLNADRLPGKGSEVHAARANRGEVMNILREKLGVNDGSGQVLFQSAPPTDSIAFKAWFGNSQVVDENGEPLIVYHSSYANFGEDFVFDASLLGENTIGNATDPAWAATSTVGFWANTKPLDIYSNAQSVYYKIENPKEFYSVEELAEELRGYMSDDTHAYDAAEIRRVGQEFADALKSEGYDGLIVHDEEFGDTSYVAFSPEQIKAVNNHGTWNPADPRIFYQSAWHGTPHRFDEFSLDAIGTGEGAQAHGWGLYFAEDRKVSEGYKNRLTGRFSFSYKGVKGEHLKPSSEETQAIRAVLRDFYDGKASDLAEAYNGQIREQEKILADEHAAEWQKNMARDRLAALKDIDVNQLIVDTGQLFEVDIPENDVLLDEQKELEDQPKAVREAIMAYFNSRPDSYIPIASPDEVRGSTGRNFYRDVVFQMAREGAADAEKAASELLNSLGIKGITYEGGRDGRCFVVFDDKAIKVLDTYYQGQNNPRAAFSPVTEAKGIIRFFQSADISSAGHEIGHSLRRVLELGANMDNAPDFVRQDWEAACAFVGAEPGAAWTVEQEEKFADSFMDYLQKGNAPSVGLRRSFTRLARWLTELYRRIRRLDVQVSPEMSRVFDRLLATERELAAAKQRDGLEYMSTGIEDIPAEFLGGEDAKEIAEAVARADLDAQAAIHDKLVRELREHMAEWRKQAASFADADPDQARLDELIEQGGIVLSEERKARYGAEAIAAIRGKRVGKAIFSKDGAGVDVEMAADMWGFSGPSAVDDFMAYLAEIPTKKALRQQFMQDAFKAWRNTWTSDEVILTEGAARMLELEEVALAKVAGGQFQNEENLRRKVTEEVLKLEIGQVEKALESLKTAARENSEAVRAIYRAKLKDKAAQALELKQKQRRAVAEIRERYKAKELRRKGVAQIQRMTRAKTDVIDYEWLEQMRSVANRFGLGGRRGSVRTPEHLKPLSEFLAHVQENFDTPIPVPAWLASIPARGMDWRRLTVEQFGELTDFIKWMDHQGREAKKLTTAGQELALNEALNAMMASMNSLKGKTAIADYEKKQLGWKALVSRGRKYLAGITQFEYVFKAADGFRKGVEEMEGPHVKHIVRPLYEARSAEMAMLHDAGTALDEIMKPFRDKAGIRRSKERWAMPDVPLPEDVKKRWGALPWTYERVLMVALNMGNDGNLAALKGGFGWKDADLNRITDSLTAEDWAMVQRIWDYIDSLYPRLDAAYQAVNGLPMKKVQARRVRTKFGMLRGGYFPLVFDWELSNRAAQNKETDALMNGMAALVRSVKPSDGFTKERTGGRLPPRLSLSVLTRHIQDTCHYATHAPVIHNIRKITQDKKFRNMLEDKFGEDTLAQLQTWLNNIARPQRQELTGIEEFVEWGRQMATIQALGLKLTSSMMQLTSLSASAQEIGWKPLGEGLSFIGQNRSAAYETIRALSPMMRDRAQTINADLARSMDRLNPDRRSLVWEFGGKTYETSWNDVQRAVFAPMTFCDSIVAYSTWWGAYQKALRETEGDQNAAVTYADRAVSLAQSSGNAVNLSTLQQATGYKKLLTMFMTYTMNLQNRIRFQTRGLMEGMISPAQYMEYMFNDVATPAVVGMILKALLEGGDVPDDPRDYAKEIGYYMLSGFPLLRDAQSLYEYGGDISVVNSSISRGFSAPFMAARGAYKWWTADSPKKKDAALFSFIKYMGETAGFAMGIPSRPIFQFFQGASDIVNGKTDNPFALFVKQKDEKKK